MSMIKCGEPGCPQEFLDGRDRRRHVHNEHRTLPYICHECNDEPFLDDRALEQHTYSVHINPKPNRGRRRKKKSSSSALSMDSIKPMDSLSVGFSLLSTGSSSDPRMSGPTSSESITKPAMTGKDLFDTRSSVDLNNFITDKIQPDSHFLANCGKAVDEVVNFLQHNAPQKVRPTEVIKSGSLSHGTAVIGKSDVDLVVMIKGYDNVHDLRNDMESVLDSLEEAMESYPNITVTGRTHWAVEVAISTADFLIDADILPAIQLPIESTASRHQVYEKMGREPMRTQRSYSACLAPLQKKLFEGIPTQLKSLIRLVKYWKKNKLQEPEVRKTKTKWPASYALELIIIDRWTKVAEPLSFDMTRALHSVLTSLKEHQSYRITLPNKMFYGEEFLKLDKVPYIMDPCNPFNNVYYMGEYDWDAAAVKAAEWLRNPLFEDCDSGTENTW